MIWLIPATGLRNCNKNINYLEPHQISPYIISHTLQPKVQYRVKTLCNLKKKKSLIAKQLWTLFDLPTFVPNNTADFIAGDKLDKRSNSI